MGVSRAGKGVSQTGKGVSQERRRWSPVLHEPRISFNLSHAVTGVWLSSQCAIRELVWAHVLKCSSRAGGLTGQCVAHKLLWAHMLRCSSRAGVAHDPVCGLRASVWLTSRRGPQAGVAHEQVWLMSRCVAYELMWLTSRRGPTCSSRAGGWLTSCCGSRASVCGERLVIQTWEPLNYSSATREMPMKRFGENAFLTEKNTKNCSSLKCRTCWWNCVSNRNINIVFHIFGVTRAHKCENFSETNNMTKYISCLCRILFVSCIINSSLFNLPTWR